MPSSPTDTAAADVKTALEKYVGHPIEASPEQIEQQLGQPVPFSNYDFTPPSSGGTGENVGQVLSHGLIIFVPPSCRTSELLDVSGFAFIGDSGNVTISVKGCLCPNEDGRAYSQPVIVVATPVSSNPVFLSTTHTLIRIPPSPFFTDVQIQIFAWDANGAPAPNVNVNWRCRVPTGPIIQ